LAVIAAVVGGVIYYRKGVSNAPSEATPTTKPEPTSTETTSPTPTEVDLSSYSISILNGSGIPGTAGKVADLLKNAGVKKINTGNASSYDFEATSVSMKKSVPEAVFEKIREVLSKDYAVVKSEDSLEDNSTYDIIIIVGVKKS